MAEKDEKAGNSQDDVLRPAPSYRAQPSSSNVTLDVFQTLDVPHGPYSYPPSPAYRSRVDMTEETLEGGKSAPVDSKPKVHYPEHVQQPEPTYRTHLDNVSLAGTDDDEDDSDYNWSDEEDLVDQEAKFEEKFGVKRKSQGWGLKRIITLLFSTLIGSTFVAAVMVTPGILIHFFWYENNPTDHRRYIKDNVQCWTFWAAANLLISWYLALIVDLVPGIVTFMVAAVWGHVSERHKSRIELYKSVKNTFKPVLYAASGWASWVIIFGHIYHLYNVDHPNDSFAHYTRRVYQVIEFLFFLALMVCIQRMLSHAIAFAFHRTAFKERLDTLSEQLSAVEHLRNYKPKHTHHYRGSSLGLGLSSRVRTPGFGTPVIEKDYFNWGGARHEDNAATDGDVEDADKTLVGQSKKGKRKSTPSWFASTSKSHSKKPTVTVEDVEHEMGVLRNQGPSGSTPMLGDYSPPSRNSPTTGSPSHRYPPSHATTPSRTATPSPRPSTDGHREDTGGAGDTLAAAAKVLKSAVLHDARNIKGEDEDDGMTALGYGAVGSTSEAKRLARTIYYRFKPPNTARTFLIPSDFYPAFPTTEKAQEAFRVFDRDNNGDISRSEVKFLLLRVYRERRFLARSMRDVGQALKTLDNILLFFAMIILFFISLSVFGVQVGDSLTSVYSLGIAASFIFRSTASNAFDAIMFLFVTHPYDTGDRCFIDDENLTVKKMGLFATVFTRVDGTESYYFNNQLFAKFITNVRRSGKMYENCVIQVAWRTPLSKLDELEACLNRWLSTEQNRWYEPSTSLTLQKIVYQRYLEVSFPIGHNGTWQDWTLRWNRKTAFHAAVQYYCRQLGIVGYEAPMPIVWGNPQTQTYDPPLSPGFDVEEEGAEGDILSIGSRGSGGAGGAGVGGSSAKGVDVVVGGSEAAKQAALERGGMGGLGSSSEGQTQTQMVGDGQMKTTALGFTPPEGLHGKSLLRARKSKVGKKGVSGVNMGGD
ncbi:hypothetical protein D9758_001387 [Tetrapyrgos nigripes]|uniref:EF-hand domain-containing protein n=1 Tax=Tetrapyrgos nigripes TaxID=182062 RepID=A0A8H5GS93_9AGAR|nr:hypothetical protein D9758_001387 [Tetrapyrgos nigripes]